MGYSTFTKYSLDRNIDGSGDWFLSWTYKGDTMVARLDSGDSDEIDVVREGKGDDSLLYVISRNVRLGYIGVQVFAFFGDYRGSELMSEFWQCPDNDEMLQDWETLSPIGICRRLSQFVENSIN